MADGLASPPPGLLTWRPPPADLAPAVLGFVHRDERPAAQVVRTLPDVRSAIQVMAGDPYWLRAQAPDASWRRLPPVTLWGPHHAWGYGFAAGHVRAFAVALTAEGLRALLGGPAGRLVDQVLPLDEINPRVAAALAPRAGDDFETWIARATPALRTALAATPAHDPLGEALTILATAEATAVSAAAEAAGLSERQFRRLFRDRHGVSPKRYQRAIRVDRLLRQIHERPWETDRHAPHPIAFADQPHAIREFRSLTGLTPTQYVRAKRDGDATLRSVAAPGVSGPDG